MVDEDFTFEKSPADKVTGFFGTPIKEALEAPLLGPEAVDELAETPLAWDSLCEGMLRELHKCVEKRKFFKDREDELKAEAKKFLGKDRGMVQRGEYGVSVSDVQNKGAINYAAVLTAIKFYIQDQIGEEAAKEIDAIVERNRAPSFTSVKLVPYRVGSEPSDE